jgi:hypothetical protein
MIESFSRMKESASIKARLKKEKEKKALVHVNEQEQDIYSHPLPNREGTKFAARPKKMEIRCA